MNWVVDHIVYILGVALTVVTIAHMIRQKRSPASAMAWLLGIIMVPYIGVPLYFIFGGRKMRRQMNAKNRLHIDGLETIPLSESNSLDRMLRGHGLPGATTGNTLSLYATGEEAYFAMVDLIESARTSINITTFILHADEVGRDIVDRLARKAGDGVSIRLLLDGFGALQTKRRSLAPLTEAGGRVGYFLPVYGSPFGGRANLRNHRKIAIADGLRVIAGGANIASEYMGPTPKPGRWNDLCFLVEGPAVRHYEEVFASDWAFATKEVLKFDEPQPNPAPEAPGDAVVQVIPSGPDVEEDPLYGAILTSVFAAEERFWIITPYFVPDDALIEALCLAARRGIDVRVITPKKSNHRIADLARGAFLREIQDSGGKVMLYEDGMIHAKAILIDERVAIVGSANMDMRSLFLDYEIALLIYSVPEIRSIESWMKTLAEKSKAGVETVSAVRDTFEGAVRLLAPLI